MSRFNTQIMGEVFDLNLALKAARAELETKKASLATVKSNLEAAEADIEMLLEQAGPSPWTDEIQDKIIRNQKDRRQFASSLPSYQAAVKSAVTLIDQITNRINERISDESGQRSLADLRAELDAEDRRAAAERAKSGNGDGAGGDGGMHD